ncbi:hypothetical protein NDU88_000727 [Pleurodeles waltl]|uniref:Uncharacterized protein n=1 Tax=Pleurodeles waltl TaxID=8319 RepID=A0AAV7TGJ7_PLEWA|nr:hypothetical protein NDU88_000727 [Pleurodeles waltl]
MAQQHLLRKGGKGPPARSPFPIPQRCDGPLLRHADPSGQEETDSASSDLEEHETPTNPVALPGVEGQEQSVRAFCRHKREDAGMDGGEGEEGRKRSRGVSLEAIETSWRWRSNRKTCTSSPRRRRRPAQALATLEGKRGH